MRLADSLKVKILEIEWLLGNRLSMDKSTVQKV